MESICSFEPLWTNPELIELTDGMLDEIRARALDEFLGNHGAEGATVPSLEGIVDKSIDIMQSLLSAKSSNVVLESLRVAAQQANMDFLVLVKGAITSWYMSSAPAFARDPEQGLPPDSDMEIDDSGDPVLRWSRTYASEQHYNGCLGLMGVLMASRAWMNTSDQKLKTGTLVSNAVTTTLFAAYLILTDSELEPWIASQGPIPGPEALKMFLRIVWKYARDYSPKAAHAPPAIEFGATNEEVKLNAQGKDLLTRIGCSTWCAAPYWHPCRKIPGSPWNKFMRNFSSPTFSSASSLSNIEYKVPSSALTLISPWEMHYAGLRARFDQTSRVRSTPSPEESVEQFAKLSLATDRPYPTTIPSETTAEVSHEVHQEYLYIVPMVKKPIADSHGHISLPFLATAIRGMRFEEEPDEIENDFFIMTFRE